jgi:hypothetical protein
LLREERHHLTFIHELGHFLDHQGLGAPGRYASEDGRLPEILGAIRRTDAIRLLEIRSGQDSVLIDGARGRRYRFPIQRRQVAYLLEPKETFARAYAQYIALRTRDPILLAELDSLRQATISQRVYHTHWTEEDFEPVAGAIERLFVQRGWMKR